MISTPPNPFQDQGILNGLSAITNWIKTWAVPLAGIGTVSMALLQTAKNIFSLRKHFQRRELRAWLYLNAPHIRRGHPDAPHIPSEHETTETHVNASSAERAFTESDKLPDPERDLINLVASGDAEAFYDLPIEDLCSQIKSVASIVLDYPDRHVLILRTFTRQADRHDIEQVLHPPKAELVSRGAEHASEEEKSEVKRYAAAKTRLAAQMRCSIDAIQTSIGFRWKRLLQLASVLLSGIIGVAAWILAFGGKDFYRSLASIIFIALMSGFLAPFARDLVAAVEKWRTP